MAEPIILTTAGASVMTITVDDAEPVTIRFGDITSAQASALRQQSHGAWRVPTLSAAVEEGIGPEELNGLLFLGHRQAGNWELSYSAIGEQLAQATTIRIDVALDEPSDETADDDPEA